MIRHDFRPDAMALLSYIEQRVTQFDPDDNDAPGENGNGISLVQVGFEHEQSGYVALVFDTRPDAEPDGEWTMHIESERNWIQFPRWGEVTMESFDKVHGGQADAAKIEFLTFDGSTTQFDPTRGNAYDYAAIFGDLIKKVVLAARDTGIFAKLPVTGDCQIVIEMINGLFIWPDDDVFTEPAVIGESRQI